MTKYPVQAVVVSTFRWAGFRCSKLLRLVIEATSYLLKVSVRSMMPRSVPQPTNQA